MPKPSVTDFMNFIIDGMTGFSLPAGLLEMDLNLSKSELVALFLIEKREGSTMSVLAEGVAVPMSTATGIIDRLVRRGYVRRDRSEEDRRVVTVFLTPRGREVTDRYREQIQAMLGRVLAALTPEEAGQLMRLIQKIYAALSQPDPGREATASPPARKITVE